MELTDITLFEKKKKSFLKTKCYVTIDCSKTLVYIILNTHKLKKNLKKYKKNCFLCMRKIVFSDTLSLVNISLS